VECSAREVAEVDTRHRLGKVDGRSVLDCCAAAFIAHFPSYGLPFRSCPFLFIWSGLGSLALRR
jgi:hypothetical protein